MAETATTPPKQRKPKLTTKQAKFVKAKAEGKTGVQAAMIAYDTTDYRTANTIAGENMKKPAIGEALQIAFDKKGLTAENIAEIINQGLTATKTATYQGDVYSSDEPDHATRINAAKTAAQLMGIGGKDADSPTTINFNIGTKNYIKAA